MSEQGPEFFFSYARGDYSNYLEKFFDELEAAVAIRRPPEADEPADTPAGGNAKGQNRKKVAFLDVRNVETGADWNSLLSGAIQTSKVLVCIYTARYFHREFCGKEFSAFLKRNGKLRYEAVLHADGTKKYRVRDARNIIPILWVGAPDLASHPDDLPPHLVRTIQHTVQQTGLVSSQLAADYEANGLLGVYMRGPKAKRLRFVDHFAKMIAKEEPLPNLEHPPTIDELWNAFSDLPPGYPPDNATGETGSLEPLGAGPVSIDKGTLVAIELTPASAEPNGWTLYSGGPTLAAAVAEIADQCDWRLLHLTIDPGSEDFEARAWSVIEEAAGNLSKPVLFVDPRCLKVEQDRSAVVNLLQRRWRGGVILLADRADNMDVAEKFKDGLPDLKQSQTEGSHIVVRLSGTRTENLRTAVDSVALEIFAKIADVAKVQQKPGQTDGPDVRPRISNIPRPRTWGNDGQP
jgi:hypothetical protein